MRIKFTAAFFDMYIQRLPRRLDSLLVVLVIACSLGAEATASFGSRDLTEDQEQNEENTSDEFTLFGKISTTFVYFVFWAMLLFPDLLLPVGRPGIALTGGLAMVIWRWFLNLLGQGPVFHAEQVIVMEPLFLLFGLMLTTIYIEKMESGGLFDKLRGVLDDKCNWRRAAKIMIVSTLGSAAVMNDSIALIFSGVVVDMCLQHRVKDSLPYLLALATTANIGSALTMTGNPQNILIVSLAYDEIKWLKFASNMALPVAAASTINACLLFSYFYKELFHGASGPREVYDIVFRGHLTTEMEEEQRQSVHRNVATESPRFDKWTIWSKIQLVVVILFLVCFAVGLDVGIVSISAGVILMIVSSYKRKYHDDESLSAKSIVRGDTILRSSSDEEDIDPVEEPTTSLPVTDSVAERLPITEPGTRSDKIMVVTESETILTQVDYGVLMLFVGQFLLIGAFDDTGIPQSFFETAMGGCADRMTEGYCVYWFVMIISILSNIASNVPVCLMLASTFPYASPYEWLVVAYSATIAGNLTMLGSAANIIVAQQASKAGDRSFTSARHAPFGIVSTLVCLYVGTVILANLHFSPDCSVKLGEC